MRNRTTVALLLIVVASGIASAADNAAAGKDLFASKCAICHGADGSAKTATRKNLKIRDLRAPEVQKQSDTELKTIINKGKGKMPAFEGKLTGEQTGQVTAYIRDPCGSASPASTALAGAGGTRRVTAGGFWRLLTVTPGNAMGPRW